MGIASLAIAASTWAGWGYLPRRRQWPANYVAHLGALQQDYLRFTGNPLGADGVEEQFQEAGLRALAGDYAGAAELLERASKQAAIPVIFHDLGVLYAALHDRSRSSNAFREAEARELTYRRRTRIQPRGARVLAAPPAPPRGRPNPTTPACRPARWRWGSPWRARSPKTGTTWIVTG